MLTPESVKDDLSIFPTDQDWINYTRTEVNYLCGITVGTTDANKYFEPSNRR